MKLLTITIPCYNSQEYMRQAIDTALSGGDDVEILIVDDGSVDDTLKIAREYEENYPSIVRAIHKENGGHGSAVNTGIQNASGIYFKVLDSDDWLDEASLKQVLYLLREIVSDGTRLDMLVSNYVYEKPSVGKQKVVSYSMALPKNKVISWKKTRHFRMSQNLIMHAIIYRTKLLIDCGLELPEHTFYVDNLYAYVPLPYVKKLYYLDVDLYRYFIGRQDQSVNETVMTNRIDQQIKINKLIINAYDLMTIKDFKLRKYMIQYLAMMMIVSSVLLVNEGSPESLRKRDELWQYLRNKNLIIYNIINRRKLGSIMQTRIKPGQRVIIHGYHFFNRIYGFN